MIIFFEFDKKSNTRSDGPPNVHESIFSIMSLK